MASQKNSTEDLIGQYQKAFEEARKANEQRYKQGLGLLDEAIKRYQPGGGFGGGAMAQYEVGKTQALAAGMQSLVSSGLANTTVAAGLPLKYEQEVGTPFRLQLEDLRMQNLTEAERAKAGFISARQDAYPDLGMMAQLMQQGASSGGGGGGGISTGGWGSSGGRYMNPSSPSRTSTPRTNPGMTLGSSTSFNVGRTEASLGSGSASSPYFQQKSIPEEEYQSLLAQNRAANQQSTVPTGRRVVGSGASSPSSSTLKPQPKPYYPGSYLF